MFLNHLSKKNFLIALFFVFGVTFFSPKIVQATEVSGNISASTTWTLAGSPYIVTGNITVVVGASLVIEAGVEVRFNKTKELVVKPGAFVDVQGQSGSPVIFTSNEAQPTAGNWGGIRIEGNGRSDASSNIQYAEFYYAHGVTGSCCGGWTYSQNSPAALQIVNASPNIQNCLFDSNLVGLTIRGRSDPQVHDNTFYRNIYAPISIIPDADPVFQNIIYGTGGLANANEAIGLGVSMYSRTGLVENGTIRQINDIYRDTGEQIFNIPYVLVAGFTVDDVNLRIDPGVVIKMGPNDPRPITLINGESYNAPALSACFYTYLFIKVLPGGSITAQGTPAEPIIFTSTFDDARGGDTNLDEGATVADAGDWNGVHILGNGRLDTSSTIQYAEFYYATWLDTDTQGVEDRQAPAVKIVDASPNIQNCLFDSNLVGLTIRGRSDPQVHDNTFYRNIYAPISIIPDADPVFQNIIYGTGAQANGFEAMGLGTDPLYSSFTGPVDNAHIYQINDIYRDTGEQINNITYVLAADFEVNGVNLTIEPGVIIKMGPHDPRAITLKNGKSYDASQNILQDNWIKIMAGGSITANGTADEPIIFTSTYDDRRGGDTNLDEGATVAYLGLNPSPPASSYSGAYDGVGGIHIFGKGRGDATSTIKYAQFYYGNWLRSYLSYYYAPALEISDASPLIQNCLFDSNLIGLMIRGRSNPQIYDNTFYRNIYAPITIIPDANPDFQRIIYGIGSEANAFEAIGLGIEPYLTPGPIENAFIRQINDIYRGSFAPENQINNITYLLFASFEVENVNLTIEPGVVIKMGPPDPRSITLENDLVQDFPSIWYMKVYGAWIKIMAGGSITANGTADALIIFTSTYDDRRGGDTNLDDVATIANAGDWGGIHIFGNGRGDMASAIQYAQFYYARWGYDIGSSPLTSPLPALEISDASPLIQNCLFDSNLIGLMIRGRSNPQIYDNTFYRNIYAPITIIPDANPDFQRIIYGIGSEANAFEAIGLGVLPSREWGPVENAFIRQIKDIYRGSIAPANQISNITYILVNDFKIDNGINLTIEPGVVIKMGPSDPRLINLENGWSYDAGSINYYFDGRILINAGGSLNVNGEDCNVVSFTSIYDDTRGGDTNLDLSATFPAAGDYKGLFLSDNSSANISYTEFFYGGKDHNSAASGVLRMESSSCLISKTAIKNNKVGVYILSDKNPVIALSQSNFLANQNYGIKNDSQLLTIDALNLWWGSDTGPTHSSNPGGNGDKVSDRVNFVPFRDHAFGLCPPDKPSNLNSTLYSPCSPVQLVDLLWTYSEQTGSLQKAYRVEIDDENSFNDPILWKSCDPDLYCLLEGTTIPETFTIGAPTTGIISYGGVTYYWRVKVFDQELEESVWSDPGSFITDSHAGPQVSRTVSPARLAVDIPVDFTDTSTCYDGGSYDCITKASPDGLVTYFWDFGDYIGTSQEATPTYFYLESKKFSVLQQVTDEDGIPCSDRFNVFISLPLPKWKEIPPTF